MAKFKVGDKVRIKFSDGATAVETITGIKKWNGKDAYTTKESGGMIMDEDIVAVVNSCRNSIVDNARDVDHSNAEVGDKVCALDDYGSRTSKTGTLVGYQNGYWKVKWDAGGDSMKKGTEIAPNFSRNSVVANALAWKRGRIACNADMVEVKRKKSGVKTVVSIDDIRKGREYGKDLTGYERNMLGRGIDKLSTDEFVYSLVKSSASPSEESAINTVDNEAVKKILLSKLNEKNFEKEDYMRKISKFDSNGAMVTPMTPETEKRAKAVVDLWRMCKKAGIELKFDKNKGKYGEYVAVNSDGEVVENANWSKNSYKYFCVDPSLKSPCIHSGWDYQEDAKDDAKELKELHIPFKIVTRTTLERNGIDPNAAASWKTGLRGS